MPPSRTRVLVALFLVVTVGITGISASAQTEKRSLGHESYEVWKAIDGEAISPDGRWILYSLTLQNEGDAELVIRNIADGREYRIPRGVSARFDAVGDHVFATVRPPRDAVRQAKLDNKKADEQPKSGLVIVDLASGTQSAIERVKSFRSPADAGDWIAYLLEKETLAEGGDPDAPPAATTEPAEPTRGQDQPEAGEDREPKTPGTRLVLRDLASGAETSYANVVDYAAAADGSTLAYLTATADDSGDGAFLVAIGTGTVSHVLADAPGHYSDLAVADTGGHVAFLSDHATYADEQPAFALYRGSAEGSATLVAAEGTVGIADGWWVSADQTPSFSASGQRLFFGTAPRPAVEEPTEDVLDEDKVVVDIWNWRDPLLQPMQLLRADQERRRTYAAVAHLGQAGDRVVQLASPEVPDVDVADDGDSDYAYGESSVPYRKLISWEFPAFADHVLVDVRTGERTTIAERHQGPFSTSPDSHWALWWNSDDQAWVGRELARDASGYWGMARDLTSVIGWPVHDEDHDWAYDPMPYGLAGWLQVPEHERGEGAPVEALIYDRYDIWAVDPAGVRVPREVTSGYGREEKIQLRYVELDREAEWVARESMLLSGLHEPGKDAGFWEVEPLGTLPPEQLIREPKRFGRPTKARDAEVLMYTREDIREFPDLWVTGLDFSDAQKVSDANPQQDEYNWATAELTTWRSLDGEILQGLVHKPENFDPAKKYPMVVYFYERNSNNLHAYSPPTPHRSTIRPSWYASRGYVVFTPDITYAVGYPGESALKDVLSGVLHMIDQGYIDAENIGTQGHSWGGYQIAYLVTKTDIFKAAAGGAPVSNMTSAYGGIRWGSGMSRMFQYEKTQSRLGGSLWESPLRYIENSPVFWADKVTTPLLMLHNDEDGAVPWEQGIEMFVALRRLGKPAWLVNYNGEPHWPTTYPNIRDWNIRMQQFFDHYLMGAPAPVWLEQGVPAIDKGTTLGLELLGDQERR